jgi:hypothetical protein
MVVGNRHACSLHLNSVQIAQIIVEIFKSQVVDVLPQGAGGDISTTGMFINNNLNKLMVERADSFPASTILFGDWFQAERLAYSA